MRCYPLLLLSALHAGLAASSQLRARGNPIRKIIKMLQLMEDKTIEEGKKQEQLYDKYMCYCRKTVAELGVSIAAGRDRIPQLESSLKEATAMHQQFSEDVKTHLRDRRKAEETLSTAVAIRTKDSNVFAKDEDEMKANVASLDGAIKAVEKGQSDLQTDAATLIRKLSLTEDLTTVNRDVLTSFLDSGSNSEEDASYKPESGEILGILKQLKDGMEMEMEEGRKDDEASKGNHESLVQAKRKEISAATKAIQEKMGRVGELAVQKVALANSLEDSQEGLEEDSKFQTELQKSCKEKADMWGDYQKMMGQEKMALLETIKLLDDDDAANLFSKTLSGQKAAPSFLQVSDDSKTKRLRGQALAALRKGADEDHRMAFLVLALRGEQKGMDEVKRMIDNLVVILQEDQAADNSKKDYCEDETDRLEDQGKTVKRAISDIETGAAEVRDSLNEVVGQIAAMVKGIEQTDAQVKEATKVRKEEHSEFETVMAENNAATSLIELAKNRLHKFYNPKLYRQPKTEEEGIARKFGMEPDLAQVSATPMPGPDLGFKNKGRDMAGGVQGMMDLLKEDLLKQSAEIKVSETRAQENYEEFIKNSADKRVIDSKALADHQNDKADSEQQLHDFSLEDKTQRGNMASTEREQYILHKDCDFLLRKYAFRKEARADEIDSLNKAKAVLAGANYE